MCVLHLKKVDFLGHAVSADGVSVQTSKINAVKDWPAERFANAMTY